MDAQSFLAQRLESYQQSYYAPFMERLQALKLTNDTPEPDIEEAVRGMDPAVIRGEFDGVVRAISADFVAAFNEMLGMATAREPLAARFAERYRMRPEYQLTFEQQLRSSLTPLWAAIAEVAPARHAYLAFRADSLAAGARAGLTGGTIGGTIGSFIFPGVGTLVGAMIGGALMGNQIDERGQNLLNDWNTRYTAVLHAVDAGWEQLSALLSSRFETTFGEALQRLSQDVAAEKHRIEEERRRIAEERRRVEEERRRIEVSNREARLLEQRIDEPRHVIQAPRRELGPSEPHWTVKFQGAAWAIVGAAIILGVVGVGGAGIWYASSHATAPERAPSVASNAGAPGGPSANLMRLPDATPLLAGPADSFATVAAVQGDQQASVLDGSVPGWTKVQLQAGTIGWVSDKKPLR